MQFWEKKKRKHSLTQPRCAGRSAACGHDVYDVQQLSWKSRQLLCPKLEYIGRLSDRSTSIGSHYAKHSRNAGNIGIFERRVDQQEEISEASPRLARRFCDSRRRARRGDLWKPPALDF